MGRAIKIIVIVILAIVVLLAAAIFVVTQVIDPNDFKPQIEEQARQNANLDLSIPGDLSWQFWPSLGVSLGRTEARIADEEELFAALDNASVSVAVWPLLLGKVEMDGVLVDGLEVNLREDQQGGNWERIGPQNDASPDQTEGDEQTAEGGEEGNTLDIPLTIPSVDITNGRISYRNATDGTDIRVEHFNFNARDVSLDQPFPLEMSLRYQDQSDMRVDLNLKTTLAANLDANHFVLNPMVLDANIAGATTQPVDVHLEQALEVNLEEDSANLTGLVLQAAGTRTTGEARITGLTGDLVVAGKLDTEPFNLNTVLKTLGEPAIETRGDSALNKVAMSATLSGPANSVIAKPLTITLDDSTINGSAGLQNLETGKIVFDLSMDKILLDQYLPPESSSSEDKPATTGGDAGKSGGTANLTEAELIPVETLRPLLLDGKLRIGHLTFEQIEASDLSFAVSAANGVLKLTQASGKTLNGDFSASGTLDVAGKTPRISARTKVNRMQIQPIAKMAMKDDLATGLFSMDGSFNASGNSQKALVESAKGNLNLGLADGTVRGLNLYNTLVGGINDTLGGLKGLTALIPDQQSGKLPSVLSEDTKIIDLTSKTRLDKQVAYLESLDATLEKGSLSGNGWFNVLTQQFDMHIGMKSPELDGGKYLGDATWPLRCQGSLESSPAKWCGPDRDGFRKIAQQAATNAAKGKLKDKLGIDAEGDTTEEVLKNAAGQKAREEIEKQRDKLNEKLGDKLKGLFN